MRTFHRLVLALFLLVSTWTASAQKAPPPYLVIIHPGNPVTNASRKFIADAFLKKTTRWDHGETIRPVDQASDSTARRAFSEEILKRSIAAVRSYWQQVIFSGRDVPPPELQGDEDVVAYVLKHGGAIGYVSGGVNHGNAKVLTVY